MDTIWKRLFRAAGDNQFGPQSPQYPDLTLGFEDAILTIPLGLLLLLLTPFYIWHYLGLPVITAEEPLIWGKARTNGALIVLQVVSAVFYNSSSDSATSLSLAASVVACLAAFALAVFMHFEHRHALESSPFPALYLFVTLLLDIAKARSYFLRAAIGFYDLACVTTVIAALKLILLLLGELPKRYQVKRGDQGLESTYGFWGRTLLIWLNSTLFLGFRNVLSTDDLPDLDPSFASAKLAATFEPIWEKRYSSSYALVVSTLRAQIWSFLGVIPPRLLHTGFTFAEPLLLRRCLQQLGLGHKEPRVIRGLIGAMALVQVGLAVTRVWSAGTTLMSTDVDGIVNVIPSVHETWASAVELGLSIYLLSTVISKAAFLVALPAIVATVLSLEVGRRLALATLAWNQNIEKRVSITSQILTQMRGIKMMAAEDGISDYIQSLREAEVEYSKRSRKLSLLTTVALEMSYSLTPIVVMAGGVFWSGFDNGFNATDVFTALAFIYLAAKPMAAILNSWPKIGGLTACFSRIQAYLLLEERLDSRDQTPEPSDDKPTILSQKGPLQGIEHFPIQLTNASVASPDGSVLFTANLSVPRSSVTMIIGPTGVGKSTLLRSLLGEAKITHGSIYVSPQQIAYCGQEEWIRNTTIRDNIIGENAFDEEWYRAVISACLLSDLEEFPHGDSTLAGSRGANLSGGQRQRVALARAAFSRAPIILLDNSLSALDRTSSSTILRKLVDSDGLLRSIGSTVVISTHSVELLKSADRALVINSNGTVTTRSPQSAIKEYEGQGFLDDFSDDSEDISDGSRDDSPARHYTPEKPKPQPNTSLRQTGDLKLYKYYVSSVRRSVFIMFLLIMVLHVSAERAPDVYMRIWVDNYPDNKKLFIGYALIGASSLVFCVVWSWSFYLRLVPESAERLHRVLLDTLTNASLSFLTYTDAGALLNRFSQDMSPIIKDLPATFFMFSYAFSTVIVSMGILASTVKYVATLLPFLLTLLWGIQLYYLRTSRQMRTLDIEAKSPIYTYLTECSEGIHHIRAFQWEQQYLSKGLELLDRSQKPFYYMYSIQSWLGLVLDLTVAAVGVVLVALGLSLGSTTQAALGLGLLKVLQINSEMIWCIAMWVSLETSLGAVSRIRAFEKETPLEGTGTGAGVDGTSRVADSWPHRGEVEVNNVSADYTIEGVDYRALHEVSVKIAPGTKVGLVGRTGSGKSTFLLTLLNLLKFSGSIIIDGVDITTIPRHLLRSRITTISQEAIDLPGSIRGNLAPQEMIKAAGERTSDAKLFDALQKVGLKDVIVSRGGLDKSLDQVGLSAGEQQLLALARALVHHSKVKGKLIFVDEATSHIDYNSEAKLREVMTEAFGDCTVITIAHRYHTLNNTTLLELSAGHLVSYE